MIKPIVTILALVLGCSITACNKAPEKPREDSTAYVQLTGGTGRAYIHNPVNITQKDDGFIATLEWSSKNYDYMIVDGKKYEPVGSNDGSVFEIPFKDFDVSIPVIADTTAMGSPHEIEYQLIFLMSDPDKDDNAERPGNNDSPKDAGPSIVHRIDPGGISIGSLDLSYAKNYKVDYYDNGIKCVSIKDEDYLLVPSGTELPEWRGSAKIIRIPVDDVYLAASSAMDLILQADAVKNIKFTGTKETDWTIERVRDLLKSGNILYAGKYNAPDYEMLIGNGCDLAIESTMIYHSPQTLEKLEDIGITVLTEHSSSESHPLGRMEWIKLYGLLFDKLPEAEKYFEDKTSGVQKLFEGNKGSDSGPRVAYFYITSQGSVNVKGNDDYIAEMIDLSGGRYFLKDSADSRLFSGAGTTISRETFYIEAMDADIFIYNSTISGEYNRLSELLDKEPLLADTKAVKNNKVWCTRKSMFQQTGSVADIMLEMNLIFEDKADDDMEFFYRLK